jgi:hypothetical protein
MDSDVVRDVSIPDVVAITWSHGRKTDTLGINRP